MELIARDQEAVPTTNTRCKDSTIVSPGGRFLKYPSVIGRGSQKTVFRGFDKKTKNLVAWCELMPEVADKIERIIFRKEARLLSKLNHPHIVQFYANWDVRAGTGRNVVMVTELMILGNLKEYAARIPRISSKMLGNFCQQILSALQYLHSKNPIIIHRDIKCENIFVTGSTGLLKIGDLGAAITEVDFEYPMGIIGTEGFMAPEIFNEIYDSAVDVYAFGMTILELITSEYPYWECSSSRQVYKKVVKGIKPKSFGRVLNKDARAVIEWCIQTKKKNRPTCKDLLSSELLRKLCMTSDGIHQSPPLDQKLPLEMPSTSPDLIKPNVKDMEKAVKDLTIDLYQSPPLDQKLPLEMPSSFSNMIKPNVKDMEKAVKDLTIDLYQSPPLDQKLPLEMPSSFSNMIKPNVKDMEKAVKDLTIDIHQSPPLDQKLPLEMPSTSSDLIKPNVKDMEKAVKDLTIDKKYSTQEPTATMPKVPQEPQPKEKKKLRFNWFLMR